MKRDARIGLAVVLVLGLAVTLLVGRAIYKRTPQPTGEGDVDSVTADNGSSSGSDARRVDSAQDTSVINPPQPAQANTPLIAPGLAPAPGSTGVVRNPDPATGGLQRFIEDQTGHSTPAGGAGVIPTGAAGGRDKPPIGQTGDDRPRILPPDDSLGDHEQTGPLPRGAVVDSQGPKDGYAYTIAAGDNMWKISAKVYGDGKFTQKIVEANPHLNAQKMKVGTLVRIPIIANKTVLMKLPSFGEGAKAAQEAPVANPTGPVVAEQHVKAPEKEVSATTHKVEAGETLSSIAKKYYGAAGPKVIARITAANHGLEPSKLKVGQEINIPGIKASAPVSQ